MIKMRRRLFDDMYFCLFLLSIENQTFDLRGGGIDKRCGQLLVWHRAVLLVHAMLAVLLFLVSADVPQGLLTVVSLQFL